MNCLLLLALACCVSCFDVRNLNAETTDRVRGQWTAVIAGCANFWPVCTSSHALSPDHCLHTSKHGSRERLTPDPVQDHFSMAWQSRSLSTHQQTSKPRATDTRSFPYNLAIQIIVFTPANIEAESS
ncbi:hypothetical protein BaRGS_00002431 [Batillaria attramentaria]|uniref:Secreted protein n=1 Tax=Batillaria attramentaria TaxID=370345 RepID=A0ABD0M4M3_9CAEN